MRNFSIAMMVAILFASCGDEPKEKAPEKTPVEVENEEVKIPDEKINSSRFNKTIILETFQGSNSTPLENGAFYMELQMAPNEFPPGMLEDHDFEVKSSIGKMMEVDLPNIGIHHICLILYPTKKEATTDLTGFAQNRGGDMNFLHDVQIDNDTDEQIYKGFVLAIPDSIVVDQTFYIFNYFMTKEGKKRKIQKQLIKNTIDG